MMSALKLLNRQNDVQHPVVSDAVVLEFNDTIYNSKDTHTVEISHMVHDVLSDTAEDMMLFSQNLSGIEYYKFKRSKNKWLFAGIDQATANPGLRNIPLETVLSLIRQHTHEWPFELFPTYVDIRALNQALSKRS